VSHEPFRIRVVRETRTTAVKRHESYHGGEIGELAAMVRVSRTIPY